MREDGGSGTKGVGRRHWDSWSGKHQATPLRRNLAARDAGLDLPGEGGSAAKAWRWRGGSERPASNPGRRGRAGAPQGGLDTV